MRAVVSQSLPGISRIFEREVLRVHKEPESVQAKRYERLV